ncbi:MAG TPA: YesL family protein [Candidatus Merdisoma merdipullorum]|nr:YesL family protein [Candidatus Merdisoma merdipullorum]
MGGLFDPESGFSSFMGKVGDLIIISFFGSLLSVTVLLACPAWAAVYYASVKSIRSEYGTARKEFFHSFRTNLRQGFFLNIVFLLYLAATFICLTFSNSLDPEQGLSIIYWIMARMLILPLLLTLPWIFPLLSRFTMKNTVLIRTAFYISVRHWVTTAVLVVLYGVSLLIIFVMPVLALILPGAAALAASFLTERVFVRYVDSEEREKRGNWELPKEQKAD